MAGLTKCIARMGKLLDVEDIERVKSLTAELRAEGAPATEASLDAVGIVAEEIAAELEAIATAISEQLGVTISREARDELQFERERDRATAAAPAPNPAPTVPMQSRAPTEPQPGVPTPLYAARPVLDDGGLRQWAIDAGIADVLPLEEMHVTLAYSKTPVDIANIKKGASEITASPLG